MNILAAATTMSPGSFIAGLVGLVFFTGLYFAPTIAAWARHAPNKASVAVVNLFLGWTVIGWIVALAMAMRDPRPAP